MTSLQCRFYILVLVVNVFSCTEKSRIISPYPEEFAGIGIEIEKVSDYARIVRVLPSSPAAKSGITVDDIIIAVDNINIAHLTLPEVIEKIRGTPDSTLTLTIESSKDKNIHVVSVKRKRGILTDNGYVFEP